MSTKPRETSWKCGQCGGSTRVVWTAMSATGLRRRRECLDCNERCSTVERNVNETTEPVNAEVEQAIRITQLLRKSGIVINASSDLDEQTQN
ncbi:MAG: hypothetical protein KDA52_12770 [Planctomycetaceae bacterium]|nr:hypothetical protein [Planctomycetaceae bacterium]